MVERGGEEIGNIDEEIEGARDEARRNKEGGRDRQIYIERGRENEGVEIGGKEIREDGDSDRGSKGVK